MSPQTLTIKKAYPYYPEYSNVWQWSVTDSNYLDQRWGEPVQPQLSSQGEPNQIPRIRYSGFQPVHRIQR